MPQTSIRCVLLAALLLSASAPSPAAQADPPAPVPGSQVLPGSTHASRTCIKPEAPLELLVETTETGAGELVLSFQARPLRPLEDLAWTVTTGGGAVRTAGPGGGALPAAGGVGELALAVPSGDRFGEAELTVSGRLAGTDERVARTERLTWGRPDTGARPVASLGVDGAPVTVAAVPGRRLSAGSVRPAAAQAAADPGAPSTFVVSGRFLYEDKAWGFSGWTGADPLLPVRRADVVVIDAGAAQVLAAGSTADDGSFALTCQASGPLDLVIRCDAAATVDPAFQAMRVLPIEGWTYVLFPEPVLDHDPTFDLDIGVWEATKLTAGSKEGNPFNVLDMSVATFELLHGPPFDAPPLPERLLEHTWPAGPETFAFIDSTNLGDDDGYDDPVILHETGHLVQALWSDMLPYGGPHSFGDSDQDPRLSFGEGFATFLAGLVLADRGLVARYVDSNGGAQNGGAQLRMTLETAAPYTLDAFGAADEVAVACALFDLLDDELTPDSTPGQDDDPMTAASLVGGQPPGAAFWTAFSAPAPTISYGSLNHLWDRWFTLNQGELQLDAVTACLQAFRQDFREDAAEPDGDPGSATLLEPVSGPVWTGPYTLYAGEAGAVAPGTGDQDWFAHELVIGSRVKFVTRYPGGANDADTQADTRLELFDPDGASVAVDLDSGVGRNARLNDFEITATGTWTVQVTAEGDEERRYGRYEYRAQMLFENHVPELVGTPDATPNLLTPAQTATLTVQAVDANGGQLLDAVWTPLDGGTITGAGLQVGFVPPAVDEATEVRVQVVVLDELGAASAPGEVVLTVVPAGPGPCAEPAAVTDVGGGKAGQLGVPVLSAVGLPVVPSSDLELRVEGVLPGLAGWLVAGFQVVDAPFDQGTLHPHPDLLVALRADAAGGVALVLPLPADAGLCGVTVATQALFPGDPGAGGALHTAQSNGLDLTFGQ